MNKQSIKKIILGGLICWTSTSIYGQVQTVDSLDSKYLNWHNTSFEESKQLGIGTQKAYDAILKGKTPKKKVVVAVIDSGVDTQHEDLQGKLWINKDEIPNNNIDDDNNGYIDDVYGWNFIGNAKGENVDAEQYEYTRIVKIGDKHPNYLEAFKLYEAEFTSAKEEKELYDKFAKTFEKCKYIIQQGTGITVHSPEDLKRVQSDADIVKAAKEFLSKNYQRGFTEDWFVEVSTPIHEALDYHLNLTYTPREVIGDNPEDIKDNNYGNADVKGPTGTHGTGVSGVIAAVRGNGIGIDGICENVSIMALRAVPNGDERDKDIALAIRYAVDNGADIINMSFGKSFSPQKQFVDDAIKYAEKKGVLLVHAAGNEAENLDVDISYPSDRYSDGTIATNFLSVGASASPLNKHIPAPFSNYGQQDVDLFAPGMDIITLDIHNKYDIVDGTSFAAPVVSGVAALILSYYPDLTPQEVIQLLLDTSFKIEKPKKVYLPTEDFDGKKHKVRFSELSKCGGVVNVYQALLEAEKRFKK